MMIHLGLALATIFATTPTFAAVVDLPKLHAGEARRKKWRA